MQAVRVARRDDHVRSLLARPPGRLEPDAGATADHDHRLAGELRFAAVAVAPIHAQVGVHRDSILMSCGS